MSALPTIAISPAGPFENESAMINSLLAAGLRRYHIYKLAATEQSIAEILEGVEPRYLSLITLHSHYHLVLAYGVGGIHYSLAHRTVLGDDYPSKVNLYQSFGVKVSTDARKGDGAPADYFLSDDPKVASKEVESFYFLTNDLHTIQRRPSAILLDEVLGIVKIDQIVDLLSYSQ